MSTLAPELTPAVPRDEPAAVEAGSRDMAEVASDWLWETNAEHRFAFISQRIFDTSGISRSQIVGREFGDLVEIGFDREGMEDLRATIEDRREFHDAVHRVALAGQQPRLWLLSGMPFFDPAGAFAGYRGTGTDVTERVARETVLKDALRRAELAEREAWHARTMLVDAIEAIPEGFVLHDAEDRLVLCNTRYGEIYGLTADLMQPGVTFEAVLRGSAMRGTYVPDGQNLEEWVAMRLARHQAAGSPHSEQRLTNGRWLKVVERRTSDGGIVGIRVDVTEARQREAVEREREKLAALGHLAGGVAHEINNLLQPAMVFPALVRDRLPPEDTESREDLECVLEGVRKVREIVRNILLFARGEEPVLTRLDLIVELRAALSFVRDLLPPSISIAETNLDACRGCVVAANKTQLTQVLTNLLVNAAQATQGSGTIIVSAEGMDLSHEAADRLSIEPGHRWLAVAVADTGAGMSEATRARVFEPFFTTKPVGQGTGLGLSVVHGIVRSWHGAITVESTPGVGSTFTLYLPIVGVAET
jgi:signal transduction histidine kinase